MKTASDAGLAALMAVTCSALLWAALHAPRPIDRTPPTPREPVSLDGAAVKGRDTAPVVVIAFADYRCPACRTFETDTLPRLEAAYIATGQVQWAFRHHPIEQLHPAAVGGARAAACAGARGKFWEMHAALFADPNHMDRPALLARATTLGLDAGAMEECLDDASVAAAVQRDVDQATALQLRGTPAFLVGRREPDGRVRVASVIPGAAPFEKFRDAIDDAFADPRRWRTRIVAGTGIGVLGAALAIAGLRRARKRRVAADASGLRG